MGVLQNTHVLCRPMAEGSFTGILEASTAAVAAWLTGPTFDAHLFSFFPSSNIGSQVRLMT